MNAVLKRLLAVGATAALAISASTAIAPRATAAAEPDATRAANYLVKHLPTSGDGASASMAVALGLATTGQCTYAPAVRTLVTQIQKGAKAYLYPSGKLNQARAANLSLVVSALGLNPRKFAGYNLASLITKGLPKDGQIGPSKSAFSQSLGIIARKRAAADIPVTLLTNLLSQQDDSGAFGYEYPAGTFNADPDTTALGTLALVAIGQLKPQLNSAVAWAKTNQTADGYWQNYSPVDSTALIGSAMKAAGQSVTAARAWLGSVQRADGGFPNSLDDGTPSDALATANALYLITGKSALDVSLNLSKCPKSPPALPKSTTSCTGVWVVIDRGNGQDTVRCATSYGTGMAALKSAGVTTRTVTTNFGPFLCQIQSFPSTCSSTSNTYWGYWYANPKVDGTWDDWTEYGTGAAASKPVKGAAEGWLYGPWLNGAKPDLSLPPRGYAAAPVPTITGTAKKGQTLTVTPGTWTPKPGAVTLRWYRSGKSISGATKATYKLASSDVGKTITVRVTASGTGLQTLSRTSLPTVKVAK